MQKRRDLMLKYGVLASVALGAFAGAAQAEVKLWRLDCGDIQVNDLNAFSDTMAYTGQKMALVGSCYLIQHGSDYLLWDTGLPAGLIGAPQDPAAALAPTLKVDLKTQLAEIGVAPEAVTMVGISHYHFDHTGQAAEFPQATLLIGAKDIDTLKMEPLPAYAQGFADPAPLAHWISGGGKVEATTGDKDVFGDGSVVMLQMPGHTPGETALMVNLAKMGPVLLSGDVVHFAEQLGNDGVPGFNFDRSETLASIDRLKKLVENDKATLIIQHDARDVAKLAAFPAASE
jgi:N-acyl homoserine lactone hydrolase